MYQITTTYFCAGVVVDQTDVVIEAAPILHWAVGKLVFSVLEYYLNKGVLLGSERV